MTEVKFYEEDNFLFEYMPQGSPFEGTLVTRFPEHEPYIDGLCLTKAGSRAGYAKRAQEECGIGERALKKALHALASKRREEVAAAARGGEETDAEGGLREMDEESGGSSDEAELLASYAEDADLFHTPDGKAYATFEVGGHRETWAVEGRRFELYLRQRYYEDEGAAPKTADA